MNELERGSREMEMEMEFEGGLYIGEANTTKQRWRYVLLLSMWDMMLVPCGI